MENGEPTHHNIKDLFNVKGYIHNSKIVLTSIILLIFVVVLILFIHLYARWFLLRGRRPHRRHFLHQSSDDFIFYLDSNDPSTLLTSLPSRGLHTSVISLLPVFNYDPDTNSDDPPECAVCLSEFEEGETGRVLPKCNHVFHIDCIDMWFHSHPTCPLCRSLVEAPPEDNLPDIVIELSEPDPDSSSASEENQIGGEDSKPSSEEDVIVEVDGFRDESSSISDSPST